MNWYKNRTYVDENKIKRDFLNYADPKTKKIKVDGMEKMGKTLGIDIYTDIFITYFFFKCNCKSMEEVTEKEYVDGMKKLSCNTLADLKNSITSVREELLELESKEFKSFYNFLFTFNVDKKKLLDMEVVEVYFTNLFEGQFPIVKKFLTFLKDVKKVKGLNKDQWQCFIDFLLNQGATFPTNYNCDDYYPLLYDEFYQWFTNKTSG